MSDSSHTDPPRAATSIAGLVRTAGARPAPSIDTSERVYRIAHQEYLAQLARRRRRRVSLVLAAGIALAVIGVLVQQRLQSVPVVVAQVVRVVGEPASLFAGQSIRSGDELSAPPGVRALLAHTSNIGIRVDESSHIVFETPQQLRLERGAVYIETPRGDANADPARLAVVTAYGTVSHVGTRFEVRIGADQLQVRVRDGAALFRSPSGANTTVTAGEQLRYRGGAVTVAPGLSASGPEWQWAETIAPVFQIEQRNLLEALEWFAHEGGLGLEFGNAAARTRASTVILHGTVDGLTPRQAIEVILSGTELTYVMEQDRLVVN